MSDSNITKMALADSLKRLMAEKTFSKIRVDDIVNGCGLRRQSFYYHFKDKYDLMNWIYYTETARFMASYDTLEHWTDGLNENPQLIRRKHITGTGKSEPGENQPS
jgi:AcrR family transcriptional regulator